MVYAYDEGNKEWLGGVFWGYAVHFNAGHPTAEMKPFNLRSKTGLKEAELKACLAWNSEIGENGYSGRKPCPT